MLGLALISAVFLVLVLTDSQYVFLPSEGIYNDQYRAAMLLEQWRSGEDSFLGALVEGRLPTGRYRALHHGTFLAYLYLPFHWLLGASWWVARYWCLFLELGALACCYGFMRRVYGPLAALLTLALLVLHPGYVLMLRVGAAFFSPMHLLSCGCLYLCSVWWDTRRPIYLALATATLGLGLSSMIWFGWLVAGLGVAAVVMARPVARRMNLCDASSVARLAGFGLAGGVVGSSLLIYRQWSGQFDLLGKVSSDVGGGFGVYLQNIPLAWATLSEFWWSFSDNVTFGINPSPNTLYPWAVAGAIAVAAALSLRNSFGQPHLLLPVVLAVMVAQLPLALRPFSETMFFLYPFPQMVLAAAIVGSAQALRGRKTFAPFLACVLVLGAAEFRSLSACVTQLKERIELGGHLTPTYHLAEWLRNNQSPKQPLFLNEGDRAEPYLYFLEPARGPNLVTLSPGDLLRRIQQDDPSVTEWFFVYGSPRVSPDVLWPVFERTSLKVEVVAEFQQFTPGDFFGPPATVYRFRRVETTESKDSASEARVLESPPSD